MTRLLLLLIFGGVVTYYFPESRVMIADKTRFLWMPVVVWNTEQEMAQVGHDVIDWETRVGSLPDRREWDEWLDYRYAAKEMTLDYWGHLYEMRVYADSIAIISRGKDGLRNTEDDLRVVTPRERQRRRR